MPSTTITPTGKETYAQVAAAAIHEKPGTSESTTRPDNKKAKTNNNDSKASDDGKADWWLDKFASDDDEDDNNGCSSAAVEVDVCEDELVNFAKMVLSLPGSTEKKATAIKAIIGYLLAHNNNNKNLCLRHVSSRYSKRVNSIVADGNGQVPDYKSPSVTSQIDVICYLERIPDGHVQQLRDICATTDSNDGMTQTDDDGTVNIGFISESEKILLFCDNSGMIQARPLCRKDKECLRMARIMNSNSSYDHCSDCKAFYPTEQAMPTHEVFAFKFLLAASPHHKEKVLKMIMDKSPEGTVTDYRSPRNPTVKRTLIRIDMVPEMLLVKSMEVLVQSLGDMEAVQVADKVGIKLPSCYPDSKNDANDPHVSLISKSLNTRYTPTIDKWGKNVRDKPLCAHPSCDSFAGTKKNPESRYCGKHAISANPPPTVPSSASLSPLIDHIPDPRAREHTRNLVSEETYCDDAASNVIAALKYIPSARQAEVNAVIRAATGIKNNEAITQNSTKEISAAIRGLVWPNKILPSTLRGKASKLHLLVTLMTQDSTKEHFEIVPLDSMPQEVIEKASVKDNIGSHSIMIRRKRMFIAEVLPSHFGTDNFDLFDQLFTNEGFTLLTWGKKKKKRVYMCRSTLTENIDSIIGERDVSAMKAEIKTLKQDLEIERQRLTPQRIPKKDDRRHRAELQVKDDEIAQLNERISLMNEEAEEAKRQAEEAKKQMDDLKAESERVKKEAEKQVADLNEKMMMLQLNNESKLPSGVGANGHTNGHGRGHGGRFDDQSNIDRGHVQRPFDGSGGPSARAGRGVPSMPRQGNFDRGHVPADGGTRYISRQGQSRGGEWRDGERNSWRDGGRREGGGYGEHFGKIVKYIPHVDIPYGYIKVDGRDSSRSDVKFTASRDFIMNAGSRDMYMQHQRVAFKLVQKAGREFATEVRFA